MFLKRVSASDYIFHTILEKHDLAPKIIKYNIFSSNDIEICMDRYDCTYYDYIDDGKHIEEVNERIDEMIAKMHNLNILHGDLHGNNIVLKLENDIVKDIRFIDFNTTRYIKDIQKIQKYDPILFDKMCIFMNLDDYDMEFTIENMIKREKEQYYL